MNCLRFFEGEWVPPYLNVTNDWITPSNDLNHDTYSMLLDIPRYPTCSRYIDIVVFMKATLSFQISSIVFPVHFVNIDGIYDFILKLGIDNKVYRYNMTPSVSLSHIQYMFDNPVIIKIGKIFMIKLCITFKEICQIGEIPIGFYWLRNIEDVSYSKFVAPVSNSSFYFVNDNSLDPYPEYQYKVLRQHVLFEMCVQRYHWRQPYKSLSDDGWVKPNEPLINEFYNMNTNYENIRCIVNVENSMQVFQIYFPFFVNSIREIQYAEIRILVNDKIHEIVDITSMLSSKSIFEDIIELHHNPIDLKTNDNVKIEIDLDVDRKQNDIQLIDVFTHSRNGSVYMAFFTKRLYNVKHLVPFVKQNRFMSHENVMFSIKGKSSFQLYKMVIPIVYKNNTTSHLVKLSLDKITYVFHSENVTSKDKIIIIDLVQNPLCIKKDNVITVDLSHNECFEYYQGDAQNDSAFALFFDTTSKLPYIEYHIFTLI